MPVKIRKLPNGKYKVYDVNGKVFAKGTTLKNAEKQKKLLNYVNAKKKKGK